MDILHEMTTMIGPDELLQLDLDGMVRFPMYLLWKDKNGKYIGCNDALAKLLGFTSPADLLGATDDDLCWSESAAMYRANDQKVMMLNKAHSMIEPGKVHDGSIAKAVSYKLPLRTRDKRAVGVIGVCLRIDGYHHMDNQELTREENMDKIMMSGLPERQKQCVYYLSRGMTIKEIAGKMNISPRTAGHYLERVKRKLRCNSRSQLLARIIGDNAISNHDCHDK